jgi:hypothetical protein
MNFSICLDQTTTPNFNTANLSTTGFSIYSNLDLNLPLSQNIPYTSLFESPLGTCPLSLTNIPEGTTYLIVVDQCNTSINVSSIFAPENINAGSITINCCYAIINLTQPLSICDECNLSFDTFSTSTVGRIIAGNLSSTSCGVITDYTIGWYRNGSTTPTFISGIGTTLSWDYPHPMVGDASPMVLDGSWVGIIHDIIINGVTYSSVAGVLGGSPLPFTSCFDTMVVAPFSCANGQNLPPYSHQISFTAQGNNATPPPISATYALSSSTNYFAYEFIGYQLPDILSMKFISGNPNGTNNPSLYSQPIYLENISVGSSNPGYSSLSFLNPITYPTFYPNNHGCILDNTYPKIHNGDNVKRVLTLTNLSRSLNDKLEITVAPSTTNPNTSWALKMQCLDTFGCDDCLKPFPYYKLKKLLVTYNCCGTVSPIITAITPLCTASRDKWTYGQGTYPNDFSGTLFTSQYSIPTQNFPQCVSPVPTAEFFPYNPANCSVPTPNSTIKYHKSTRVVSGQTQGVISMSFNNVTDYNYYKTRIEAGSWTNVTLNTPNSYDILNPYDIDNTNVNYYTYYKIKLPISTEACGDDSPFYEFSFHKSGYPLIEYVDNPTSGNDYTITIPMPVITNGITASICNSIQSFIQTQVNSINTDALNSYNPLNITNTFGSKSNNILTLKYNLIFTGPQPTSLTADSQTQNHLGYYSMNTLPFISSSTGWTNLPSLGGTPCPDYPISSSLPTPSNYNQTYTNSGWGHFFRCKFSGSSLTPSYSNIKIYSYVTSSDGYACNLFQNDPLPSQLIYEYSNSIATVYSSSYFHNGSLDLQFAYNPNWPC